MTYIFDTSPIIILYEKCELCDQFITFSRNNDLFVPERVVEEYMEGNDCTLNANDLKKAFKIVKPELNQDLLPYFNFDDSSGEIWVISYALQHPESWCVVDEDFGRGICNFFHLKLIGSIGILQNMKRMKIFSNDDLKRIRITIRESHFYLSRLLLNELDEICREI